MLAVRVTLAVVLVGGAAVGGVTASAAPTVCGPGGTVEDIGGDWLALRPTFTAGPQEVRLAAVPAFDPNLLYASNGTVVMRSTDAGCSWDPFWSATAVGAPGTVPTITSMHVPSSANNSTFLYLGVTSGLGVEQLETGLPTVVVGSVQRGQQVFTVADAGEGLPAIGAVRGVVANAQVPLVGYAVVDVPAAGRQLYATTDGGVSWTQRSGAGGVVPAVGLTVHPTIPTDLYGVVDGTVVGSSDGGATFTTQALKEKVSALSSAAAGGGMQLTAAHADAKTLYGSADRGNSWQRRDSPVVATSVAQVPVQTQRVVVADADSVWLLGRSRQDISPPGAAPRLLGVTAPTAKGFYVAGLRDGAILQVAMDFFGNRQPVRTVNGRLGPVSIHPRGPVTQFPSTLAPVGLRVTLPPGGAKRVPYELLVPRTPAPVDVMFLLDSTGSMSGVFDGLRKGIADITNALDSAGLNSRFGLGDFRDYPQPYGPAGSGDWPYRLDRRIGKADEEFERAIEAVEPTGGVSDGGSSPLTALMQSTTGAGDIQGQQVFVPRGQGARYRPGALKIALLSHDTPGHEGGQRIDGKDYIGPTYAQTLAALRRNDVHVMGLSIGEDPLAGLTRLATDTDTLAPPGGVDCDGDGAVELETGRPLVCLVEVILGAPSVGVDLNGTQVNTGDVPGESVGVAPAVVSLAAGIPDRKPVTLALTGGGPFVRLVSPPSKVVNLRADNELGFELSLRCPMGSPSRHVVDLTASSPAGRLAETTLTLECNGVLPLDVPELPAALAAAAAAPAAPVQSVPNANPNPNPNANPNTAPNLNANPGMANQEEAHGQLALAEGTRPDTQLEMSAARSAAFVGTAGLLLCFATAVAWRRRAQEQLG